MEQKYSDGIEMTVNYFLPVLELICNYNGALTGEISDNIIGYLGNLTHS